MSCLVMTGAALDNDLTNQEAGANSGLKLTLVP